MSANVHLSDWEMDQARKLYASGLSWRQVGKLLGRAANTLQHRLGRECSRSYSETAKIRWRTRKPGPRNLSPAGKKQYRKLRWIGYSSADALKHAAE